MQNRPGESGRRIFSKVNRFANANTARRRSNQSNNLIWTSFYDEHSGSMTITSHLDHISHCKTTVSGTTWSNRWTHRVHIIDAGCDYDMNPVDPSIRPRLNRPRRSPCRPERHLFFESQPLIRKSTSFSTQSSRQMLPGPDVDGAGSQMSTRHSNVNTALKCHLGTQKSTTPGAGTGSRAFARIPRGHFNG